MPGAAEIVSSPVDLSSLREKNVIITGAASGLGEKTAIKFAAAGAYVTLADVQDQQGEKLAKQIIDDGGKATYVHCDVCDFASATAAFKHAVNFGPHKTLDIAVLFAGVIGNKKNLVELVMESGEASLDNDPLLPSHSAIDVNLTGTYYSAFLAMNYFRLQPSHATSGATSDTSNGAISSSDKSLIFISSMAGYTDYPNNSAYAAGKFGVRGLFRSVRHYAPKIGVRMNLIAPWFVDTPMTKFMKDELERAGIENGKGFTWAPAEYVVEAVGHCAVNQVDGELHTLILLWRLCGTNIYSRSSLCSHARRLVRFQ
jgi:5'-hydroxyaverantin dehydrogenase